MLGVIHRTVLGKGPEHFKEFFAFEATPSISTTRRGQRRHNMQLKDFRQAIFTEQFRRSALGLVSIYNRLPQSIVDAPSVSVFQSSLQSMLKDFAVSSIESWQGPFSPRVPLYGHLLQ